MRKLFVLLILLMVVLSGCVLFKSKESKRLIKDRTVRAEIEQAIKERMEKYYFLDVHVNTKKIKYTFPDGKLMFPVKTDKRIEVPVETLGDPAFHFKSYIDIYDEETETYTFIDDDENINLNEMNDFGSFLLTHIFKLEYKEAFLNLKDQETTLDIKIDIDHQYYNRATDDATKHQQKMKQFAKDYEAGKFTDNEHFAEMFPAYVSEPQDWKNFYEEQMASSEPCTAEIRLYYDHLTTYDDTPEERLNKFIETIKTDPNMPNGEYMIHVTVKTEDDEEEAEKLYEYFLLCD